MNNFPFNLRYLRKKKGLLQDEMHAQLGVSRTTWSNYENGITSPSVEDLIRFSQFFGVTLDELVMYNLAENDPAFKRKKPVSYKTNDTITLLAEPAFVQMQQELKQLKEDMIAMKEQQRLNNG